MPEEDAFATLVHVMQDYHLRDLYKPLMAQLGLFMYQFECMIKVPFITLFISMSA